MAAGAGACACLAWFSRIQDDAVREAVFRYQIDRHMRGWPANQRGLMYLPPRLRARIRQAPAFYLEAGEWNRYVGPSETVPDQLMKRLQSTGYGVHKGAGDIERGSHLYACHVRWRYTHFEVDGGVMGYGDLAASGARLTYWVVRRGWGWTVIRERLTAIT